MLESNITSSRSGYGMTSSRFIFHWRTNARIKHHDPRRRINPHYRRGARGLGAGRVRARRSPADYCQSHGQRVHGVGPAKMDGQEKVKCGIM